jgi:hypothetical protein
MYADSKKLRLLVQHSPCARRHTATTTHAAADLLAKVQTHKRSILCASVVAVNLEIRFQDVAGEFSTTLVALDSQTRDRLQY